MEFFIDPFFESPIASLPFPRSDRVLLVGKGRLFLTPREGRGGKGAGPGEARDLPALLFRFPDGAVVTPRREDRETARAAVRAVGLPERGVPAYVAEGIAWELAARRTAAALLGPEAGVCRLGIHPAREKDRAVWRVDCPVPLSWAGALLQLQVPGLELPGAWRRDPEAALRAGNPEDAWFRQGDAQGLLFLRPGGGDDLPVLRAAAARLGFEAEVEPLPLGADRPAVEIAARLAHLLRGQPPASALARWGEIEETARAFREALETLDRAILLLEVWTGREGEWSRMRAVREALGRKGLPRSPETLQALKGELEKAARRPLPDAPAGVPLVQAGPFRLAVSLDGELRPLHEMEAPDPELLEREAGRLEELARAYRARAREIRGEGGDNGEAAVRARYRTGWRAE